MRLALLESLTPCPGTYHINQVLMLLDRRTDLGLQALRGKDNWVSWVGITGVAYLHCGA
jgi:hypothetical protein